MAFAETLYAHRKVSLGSINPISVLDLHMIRSGDGLATDGRDPADEFSFLKSRDTINGRSYAPRTVGGSVLYDGIGTSSIASPGVLGFFRLVSYVQQGHSFPGPEAQMAGTCISLGRCFL